MMKPLCWAFHATRHHGGRGEVFFFSCGLGVVACEICVVGNAEIDEDTSDVVMSFALLVYCLERVEQWIGAFRQPKRRKMTSLTKSLSRSPVQRWTLASLRTQDTCARDCGLDAYSEAVSRQGLRVLQQFEKVGAEFVLAFPFVSVSRTSISDSCFPPEPQASDQKPTKQCRNGEKMRVIWYQCRDFFFLGTVMDVTSRYCTPRNSKRIDATTDALPFQLRLSS